MKDVLTTAEAARLLGVSTRTAQLWVETGHLPSWKTPGGHRRIPRQVVLNLIAAPVEEPFDVRAHAIILAGAGRAAQWRTIGLPGSGLLLDIAEEVSAVNALLAFTPPMLIVVECADEVDRKKLISTLASEVRFRHTTIISLTTAAGDDAVVVRSGLVQMKMVHDVAAVSAAIIDYLVTRVREVSEPSPFSTPWNEQMRLEAVKRSGLVGSDPEAGFDSLVRLAALATRVPIAMFTLLTEAEQSFKSRVGFDAMNTPRDWAFCNETLFANEFTVIDDLLTRKDLAQNPTLIEPFGFRFYAGAPVRDPFDFALGSICIIDVVPRRLSREEREALVTIADATTNLIRLRAFEREKES